jgi:hypothetical protein
MALEVYRVATPPGDETARELAWQEFLASLERVLKGEVTVAELLRRRGRPIAVCRALAAPARGRRDLERGVGLLHDRRRARERPDRPAPRSHARDREHGYEVYISKAGKVLDQISDTFYLEGRRTGGRSRTRARSTALRRDLLAAIRAGDVRAAAAG